MAAVTEILSPGLANVGVLGEMTNGPRMVLDVLAAAIASGDTATAITRSVPLNDSGTSNVTERSSGPASTMPDQNTAGRSSLRLKGFRLRASASLSASPPSLP